MAQKKTQAYEFTDDNGKEWEYFDVPGLSKDEAAKRANAAMSSAGKGAFGTVGGATKALGTEAAKTVTSATDIPEWGARGINALVEPLTGVKREEGSFPSEAINEKLGLTYEPKGTLEGAAGLTGSLLPTVVSGPATAVRMAANAPTWLRAAATAGPGLVKSVVKGAAAPALVSEGLGDAARYVGFGPEVENAARVGGAVFGGGFGRTGMTPEQLAVYERNANRGIYATPAQATGDARKLKKEAWLLGTNKIEDRQAGQVDRAQLSDEASNRAFTGMAGREAPRATVGPNSWMEERVNTLSPWFQHPGPWPAPPQVQQQYSAMKRIQDAVDPVTGNIDPMGVYRSAQNKYRNNAVQSGQNDMANLALNIQRYRDDLNRDVVEGLKKHPKEPEPAKWLRHIGPLTGFGLGAAGAAGMGQFVGHHLLPEMVPFAPWLPTAIAGGMLGGAVGKGVSAGTKPIRSLVYKYGTGPARMFPHDSLNPRDTGLRLLRQGSLNDERTRE